MTQNYNLKNGCKIFSLPLIWTLSGINLLYELHAMDSVLQKVELGCILCLICKQS